MKIDLSGKTALVTGSTEGIGFAIAEGLSKAGATVIVNGRGAEKVRSAVARLGGDAKGIVADVSSADGIAKLLEAAPSADIVVSNVATMSVGDFFNLTDEVWDRNWQVNVMAGVRLARAYLPSMQQGDWGRFIFISSESAFSIPADMIHYGVTKVADIALARGLAKRLAGTGVTVNSVLPGFTLTEKITDIIEGIRKTSGGTFEQTANNFVQSLRPNSLIRRISSAEEVANMVVYLASPQASSTTGAALRVDGGTIDSI